MIPLIYLDHAATTPLDPRVLETMMPYLTYEFGNPGSLHIYGETAREAVAKARQQVANFFRCKPEQVIFTSGGSEGNNLVFSGISDELIRRGETGILVSAIEHDSVLHAANQVSFRLMQRHPWRLGADLDLLRLCEPDAEGEVRVSAVEEKLNEKTGLVSIMTANNETGVMNNVEVIGKMCHNIGILYHTDAVQAAGILPLDTQGGFRYADFITISGHKIGGPKGTGALFARDKSLLSPLICGGREQEFGLRGGTENVPGIVGLGKACELAMEEYTKNFRFLSEQYSQMVFMLKSLAQAAGVEIKFNGNPSKTVPKTLNACFPGVDAETLLVWLNGQGVCLSAGSACTSHENIPSHVLTAMGICEEDSRSSIRISISHINTPEELDRAVRIIIDAAKTLKELKAGH